MVKVYTIASGKGGTGKTTVSVNLGTMLAQLGKETYLMDADIGMANVGLILGLQDAPITLHEILAGKGTINDAIYEGPAGLKVIPSGISLQGFQQADPDRIRDVMSEIVKRCEFLLIDAPAGISKDGVVPLAVADEVILVVNPELSSIVDALKTKILTEVVGGHVLGSIINRVDQDKTDIITKKMEKVLGVKVIGIIPEDTNVRRACLRKIPDRDQVPDFPGIEGYPQDRIRPYRCRLQRRESRREEGRVHRPVLKSTLQEEITVIFLSVLFRFMFSEYTVYQCKVPVLTIPNQKIWDEAHPDGSLGGLADPSLGRNLLRYRIKALCSDR